MVVDAQTKKIAKRWRWFLKKSQRGSTGMAALAQKNILLRLRLSSARSWSLRATKANHVMSTLHECMSFGQSDSDIFIKFTKCNVFGEGDSKDISSLRSSCPFINFSLPNAQRDGLRSDGLTAIVVRQPATECLVFFHLDLLGKLWTFQGLRSGLRSTFAGRKA